MLADWNRPLLALRRASACADALVGAGRPLAAGPTGCTGEVHLAPTVSVAGRRFFEAAWSV